MSEEPGTEAATYTTQNKHKRLTEKSNTLSQKSSGYKLTP
jgi:hypothetical protein